MTLRRLGPKVDSLAPSNLANFQEMLEIQMKRLNDFMALMTNEDTPPTEESQTDEST